MDSSVDPDTLHRWHGKYESSPAPHGYSQEHWLYSVEDVNVGGQTKESLTFGMDFVTTQDVLACSFSAWQSIPMLRSNSLTPKAIAIRLDEGEARDFRHWMDQEGLFLPRQEGGDIEYAGDEDESDEERPKAFFFPKLHEQVLAYLKRFPKGVFPKLNWSSPKDASWIHPTSAFLRCTTPDEIYQLLKASDAVVRDLDHPFDGCMDVENQGFNVEIVLKSWKEVHRSQEWRCFVVDRRLIAISHRDLNFYPFLQNLATVDTIRNSLSTFFEDVVRSNFPISSYAFDVVMSQSQTQAYLIDFSPLKHSTDPLLYAWEDIRHLSLKGGEGTLPDIRFVDEDLKKVAEEELTATKFALNRYPQEMSQAALGTGDGSQSGVQELVKLMKQTMQHQPDVS